MPLESKALVQMPQSPNDFTKSKYQSQTSRIQIKFKNPNATLHFLESKWESKSQVSVALIHFIIQTPKFVENIPTNPNAQSTTAPPPPS